MCEVPIKTTLSSTNRPGIFSRIALALAAVGLVSVSSVAVYTSPVQAATGINKSLNYQGRLLTASGAVVADGNYNMKFKIYQDGPGNVAGNTGGTLMWTELWQNSVATGSSSGVVVRNGYFSVNLGAYCAFAGGSCQGNTNTGVDFNQDTLWLSMDVAGTAISNTPTYDGEMLPMRRLSSTVYALQAENANKLGGMTASQFLQTVPASSSVNVIAPTAASTVALTVKASTAGGANSLEVFDSSNARQAYFDASGALNVAKTIQPTVTNTVDIGLTGTQFRTGYFGTSVITPTLDTNSAVALNIGTTNATNINLNKSTTVNSSIVASATASLLQVGASAIASGSANGNYIGINAANGYTGNFVNFEVNGADQLTIDNQGTIFSRQYSGIGSGDPYLRPETTGIRMQSNLAARPILLLQGEASQTGDALQIKNSTPTVLARITAGGNFETAGSLDTYTGTALNVGGTNATSINIGKTGSNITTTISGLTVIKPSTGNDSATAFQIQNAAGNSLFNIDSTADAANLITNGSFESNTTGWAVKGGASISSSSAQSMFGSKSLEVTTTATAHDGAKYPVTLSAGQAYTFSFYDRVASGSFTTLSFGYSADGTNETTYYDSGRTMVTDGWILHSITFTPSAVSGSPYVFIKQTSATARTFYIDGAYLTTGTNAGAYQESRLAFDGIITSPLILQAGSNSYTALQVRDTSGNTLFAADTRNGRVSIGNTNPQAKLDVITTSSSVTALRVNSLSTADILNLASNSTNLVTVTSTGATTFKPSAGNDSATFFQVQNAAGTGILVVDTSTSSVKVAGTLDTTAAAAMNIGPTNASAINIGKTGSNIATTITGTTTIKPSSGNDSTTAFQIQDAAGTPLLTADTVGANINYDAKNTGTQNITSDLTGGARTSNVLSVTQANDATNNNSASLVKFTNSDTGSTSAVLQLAQVSSGTGLFVSGITSGTVISSGGLTSGTGMSLSGITTGTGLNVGSGNSNTSAVGLLYNTGSTGLTTGSALRVSGSASGTLTAYTGSLIDVQPARTVTGGSPTDTGRLMTLARDNTMNNSGNTYTISGDVASISDNCVQTAGTCTNTASVLSLNQQYSGASGSVLKVQGAGTGKLLQVTDTTSSSADVFTIADEGAALFKNRTDSTTAFQIQNAAAESLFNINSTPDATNVVNNGSFETNTAGWTAMGGASISSTTTQAMFGSKSMDVTTTATANDGVKFPISLTAGVNHKITMYARLSSGGFSTMNFGYAADGSNETAYVSSGNSMSTSGWQRYTLSFTPAAVSGSPYIFLKQTSATARTFYVDGFYMAAGANDYGIYSQSKIALNGQLTTPLIVRPASDTQAAVVVQDLSGDTILVVDSRTNRLGVGTSSPDAKVHITSSSSVVPVLKANTSSVADILNLSKSDITVMSVSDTGETLIKQYTGNDSTDAFVVQNAAGANMFQVDTVSSLVKIVGTLDTTTAAALNIGTTNATVINLNQSTTIAAGENLTVTSGTVYTATIDTSSAIAMVIGTTATTIRVGDATNNMTFASTREPTLNGTARHTRKVTLSPEYVGASMTADGTNNNGAMTSDNMTSSPYRNFYKWTNTQGTAQDYDIWVRYPLPSDWAAFPSGQTICLDTYASATTANGVTFTLYKMDNSTGSNLSTILTANDLTPTSTTTWQNRCSSSISGGSYVANGYLVMAIKMTAPATTGDIRIGDITFDYLSKW